MANSHPVVDPDLELRRGGGGGLDLLALLAFFPSVISSFFTQSKGWEGGGGAGPSPRSAIDIINPVDKTKLSCNTPHLCSTTISLETLLLYSFGADLLAYFIDLFAYQGFLRSIK